MTQPIFKIPDPEKNADFHKTFLAWDGWVNPRHRLPEKGNDVLAAIYVDTYGGNPVEPYYCVELAYLDSEGRWSEHVDGGCSSDIDVHWWMPVPKPPIG